MGTDASAAMPPATCDIQSAVARALPAIVNITVVRVGTGDEGESTPASSAVNTSASDKAGGEEHIAVFVGSGSVIDPSGIIVTNKHVIQGAALIRVIFHDKTEVPAQLIAAANVVDLALLKVNVSRPLPTLQFGNSDALRLGQPVIAIGNPLGIGTTITTGVISAVNRDLMRTPFDDFIQTDATINPGNSGGPLLNCAGEMIGVDTALLSNNRVLGSIGLGFALPSNDAKFVASRLRNPDTAVAPNWLGLHLQDLTSQLATTFGRPDMQGAIVTGIDPKSPAAAASIELGDIITAAEGHPVPDARAVLRAVITSAPGAPISLAIWRNGHATQVKVPTQPWPNMMALRSAVLASADSVARAETQGLGLGLHLAAITAADQKNYRGPDASGVLIDQITPGSQADTVGLKVGDVILRVGNQPAATPQAVMDRLAHGDVAVGDMVSMLVRGESTSRWVTLFVGRVDVANLVTGPDSPGGPGSAKDAAARQR